MIFRWRRERGRWYEIAFPVSYVFDDNPRKGNKIQGTTVLGEDDNHVTKSSEDSTTATGRGGEGV